MLLLFIRRFINHDYRNKIRFRFWWTTMSLHFSVKILFCSWCCCCYSLSFCLYLVDRINMRRSGHDYRIGSRTVSRKFLFLSLSLFFSFVIIRVWKAYLNEEKQKTKKEDNDPHHSSFSNKETNKQKKQRRKLINQKIFSNQRRVKHVKMRFLFISMGT